MPPPSFTWEEFKEATLYGVYSPIFELAIRGGLETLVKSAHAKSREELLREMLVLASSAIDPAFAVSPAAAGEAPMP